VLACSACKLEYSYRATLSGLAYVCAFTHVCTADAVLLLLCNTQAGLDERAETLIDDMKLQTMRKSFIRRSSDSPQRGNNSNSNSSSRNGYSDRGSGGSYSGSQGRSSDRS
jgi:uncharacterized membrane protein YgcG